MSNMIRGKLETFDVACEEVPRHSPLPWKKSDERYNVMKKITFHVKAATHSRSNIMSSHLSMCMITGRLSECVFV